MSTVVEERLDSLVEFIGGGTPSRSDLAYFRGAIPWVTPKDMGQFDIGDAQEHITADAVQNSATKLLPPRVVLIVVRSGVLKHSLPVGVTNRVVAINQDLKALKCSERLDPRYLARILLSRSGTILGSARGTTAAAIPLDVLRKLRVPVPPLSEQRRIAAILDKADDICCRRFRSLPAADELLASVFGDLFGGAFRAPAEVEARRLEDVSDIASGVTKGRKLKAADRRLVPYLRVANVQDGFLDLREMKMIEATQDEIDRYRLRAGDIVLTEGGDPDKLGRGAIWQDELSECIHQNHIFRVRLTENTFLPDYVSALLRSPFGKKYFLKAAKQTTGIASINRTQLGGFPLLHAPVSLQRRYASVAAQTRALKLRLQDAYQIADDLQQTLSARL